MISANGGLPANRYTPQVTQRWTRGSELASVRRLLRKEAVIRGAVPLEIDRVLADNAPDTKATVSHMQLTAIKRADAQLQH